MRAILCITLLFLFTQLFGIYLGYRSLQMISTGEMEPILPDASNPFNSVILFLYLMAATVAVILVLKYKKQLIFYIENLASFFLILLTFNFFLPLTISLILTALLLFWANTRPNVINKNLCAVLSVSSAGAILGASLDFLPALIFYIIVAFYDFASVFVTKHMVYLAKELVSRPSIFTVSTPTKSRKVLIGGSLQRVDFITLGSGDLFVPLMFSVSVLRSFGAIAAVLVAVVTSLSLFLLYSILIRRKVSRVLPAIPVLLVGSLSGLILSLMLIISKICI